MSINWIAIIVAAFVPLITGFIWYSKTLFGNAWIKAAGMTEENSKGGYSMLVVFGLSFLFSIMLALSISGLAVHQNNIDGLFYADGTPPAPDSEEGIFLATFHEKYGGLHRTFSHGLVHGIIGALFLVLPVLGTNALFEKKRGKYILINVGYWVVTFGIMGGIICGWP